MRNYTENRNVKNRETAKAESKPADILPTETGQKARTENATVQASPLRNLRIEDFHYELPEERIALYPLPERDQSKVLVYKFRNKGHFLSEKEDATEMPAESTIETTVFRQIVRFLPQPSLLVFNNTKVVRARLVFFKNPTEGAKRNAAAPAPARIEIFCLEPIRPADTAQAFASVSSCRFKCLIGNNKRWKEEYVSMPFPLEDGREACLKARRIQPLEDAFEVEFSWSPENLSFAEVLEHAGKVPLPPYIHRQTEESDTERYQTVFARFDGSVAAPTAGLHFTPEIIDSLPQAGINRTFVTLHVGAGTFKPVKSEHIGDHPMHQEHISVGRECLESLAEALRSHKPIIPVGTTSMRSIESVYWIGAALEKNPEMSPSQLEVRQWDPYEDLAGTRIPALKSIQNLLAFMDRHETDELHGITSLMIAPGYRFAFCQGLITNFHQPQSTLLLLVSALVGSRWKEIYRFALENGFRFLSYGDCCLFLNSCTLPIESTT